MKEADIKAVVDGITPVLREYVDAEIASVRREAETVPDQIKAFAAELTAMLESATGR